MTKLFGTDGIRGIINQDFSSELFIKLGKILSIFNKKKIVLGQDTRISSPLICHSLIGGALAAGLNIYDEGIVSTPCIAYLSKKFNALGIMVTASHNPYFYNGVKIFINGEKLDKSQEQMIENLIESTTNFDNKLIGKYHQSTLKYCYLKNLVKHTNKLKLKIGLDCSNGAICDLARDIYKDLTNSLYIFNNIPSGYNINENAGSTNINTLQEYVCNHNLDIGFSFDGDGDRVIGVYTDGSILSGNVLIFILAIYFFDILGYPNRSVVLTRDANLGIIKAFNNKNINVILSDIGDFNVRETMDENNIILGGEDSGHIITLYSRFGDGLLTSLLVLRALSMIPYSIEEILSLTSPYPFIKTNISKYNTNIVDNEIVQKTIIEIQHIIKNKGVILVRKSGTEDLIRLYICHENQEILDKCANMFFSSLNQVGEYYER